MSPFLCHLFEFDNLRKEKTAYLKDKRLTGLSK